MATIVRIHCAQGHLLRWHPGKRCYQHLPGNGTTCTRPPDPTNTTWS